MQKLQILILTVVLLVVCGIVFQQKSDAKGKEIWEYKIQNYASDHYSQNESELNKLGSDGWELTATHSGNPTADPNVTVYIFRRRKS